jgi:hypothetical protein
MTPAGGRAGPCRLRDDRPAEEETMRKSLRQVASALLVAAVLIVLAAPAVAAPRTEPALAASFESPGFFAELLAWLGPWLGLDPVQSLRSPAGQSVDLDGAASPSGDTESPGDATTEGRHTIDPDG